MTIYQYSRQQDIAYLRTLGVKTIKAPVNRSHLANTLELLLRATKNATLFPPSKHTPSQKKATDKTSDIECEYLRHLSVLIQDLIDFETHITACKSNHKPTSDFHHQISVGTAKARAILENLLQCHH